MIELREGERFGEEVRNVFVGSAVHDVDETGVDVLPDTKVSDVEVLGAGVDHRVVSREDRALVIAGDRDGRGRLADHVAVDEDVSKPKPFVAAEGEGNELGFVSRCRRDRLHLALPHDEVAVEEVAEAGDALALSLPGVGVVGVGQAPTTTCLSPRQANCSSINECVWICLQL